MKAEHRLKVDHGAEHRRELRTNLLADRMGRFMQSVRKRPKGRTLLYWLLIVTIILSGIVYFAWRRAAYYRNSELWLEVLDSTPRSLQKLTAKEYADFKQGQIATLELFWTTLWDSSPQMYKIETKKNLGKKGKGSVSVVGGIANLKMPATGQQSEEELWEALETYFAIVERQYTDFYEQVKDDPLLGAEVLYDIAVLIETQAVFDIEKLKAAKTKFIELRDHKTYKETAHSALAEMRLKEVYDIPQKLADMREFYKTFGETKGAAGDAEDTP